MLVRLIHSSPSLDNIPEQIESDARVIFKIIHHLRIAPATEVHKCCRHVPVEKGHDWGDVHFYKLFKYSSVVSYTIFAYVIIRALW